MILASAPTVATPDPWSEDRIATYSRERIERGSKSFATAARLFSPDVRASAYMLYAWCRHCDDEIDGQELGHNTLTAATAATAERLDILRAQTLAAVTGTAATGEAVSGCAVDPAFLALQTVVKKHAIPAHYPLDLIEGMAMDVRDAPYRTLEDTLLYSYHVAGCVGVMMAIIMGARDRVTLDRACDLGIAFQLTNIARDVMADATVGRVYLPADWLVEARVPPAEIARSEHRDAVHGVTLRLLAEADRYYASAYHGIARLPMRSALAIAAARRVYSDIGNVVREGGPEAQGRRAYVSSTRKMAGLARAGLDTVSAHTVGRMTRPAPREGLWTMPQT